MTAVRRSTLRAHHPKNCSEETRTAEIPPRRSSGTHDTLQRSVSPTVSNARSSPAYRPTISRWRGRSAAAGVSNSRAIGRASERSALGTSCWRCLYRPRSVPSMHGASGRQASSITPACKQESADPVSSCPALDHPADHSFGEPSGEPSTIDMGLRGARLGVR